MKDLGNRRTSSETGRTISPMSGLTLRVRVAHPHEGSASTGSWGEAKGLTYVSSQVTFENRRSTQLSIDLCGHPRHSDVRVGRDGHGAFVDEYGSSDIRGFNLYPQRRATATVYAASSPHSCGNWTSHSVRRWTVSKRSHTSGSADSASTRAQREGTLSRQELIPAWPARWNVSWRRRLTVPETTMCDPGRLQL